MVESTVNPRVIDQQSQAPNWDAWDDRVQKIIIGQCPPGKYDHHDASLLEMASLPDDFSTRFPHLTHLHLWQIQGLTELPALPAAVTCLDVRNCPDLARIANLPVQIESLVIEACPILEQLPSLGNDDFEDLHELSLRGCGAIEESWIDGLLRRSPNLTRLDVSACTQLKSIEEWPGTLERIDLNDCQALEILPEKWPPNMRRLELRGLARISSLDEVPASLDYLDLSYADSLIALPRLPSTLRTLFLFGSGIQMPPASEHGDSADDNVARDTQEYFEEVELVGLGEARRCKLLVLGNGSAGKTCLSMALTNDLQAVESEPDRTHGIQFWAWNLKAHVEKRAKDVHVHIWDFGGQEIYHNTHRLFMSKGTVFVLVWHPDQDDQQPPVSPSGLQDEWRPLQYWLDFIQLACEPDKPRIALVCSHRYEKTDELKQRWQAKVSPEYHDRLEWFCVNSYKKTGDQDHQIGEIRDLHDWLKKNVGGVVQAQGTVVPCYWEIAQEMVESWLPKAGNENRSTRSVHREDELELADFSNRFGTAIKNAVQMDGKTGKYDKLQSALDARRFELTPRRVERTLRFLTHSGWVYWDPALFQKRVIVGQQWALDGIYTIFDPRDQSDVYNKLKKKGGHFRRRDLDQWVWGRRYGKEEQELLLSFMESAGGCFQLVRKADSWWDEPVYLSVEHLMTTRELGLGERFASTAAGSVEKKPLDRTRLHKGHWIALLKDLGQRYGTDAEYASDGFYLGENKEGQSILIQVDLKANRLGGTVSFQVAGDDASTRLQALTAHAAAFLPAEEGETATPAAGLSNAAGEKIGKITVFFTYACDPDGKGLPANYERPVNAIHDALKHESAVDALRDKSQIKSGGDINRFMERIKTSDKVLVIHSDKYWKSPYCMYELWQAMESLLTRPEALHNVFVLVEHHSSRLHDTAVQDEYLEHWKSFRSMPLMLDDVTTPDKLRIGVLNLLRNELPRIAAMKDRNRMWDDARADEIISWVKQLIGVSPPKGKP